MKKILHVEDDLDLLEIARIALEIVGELEVFQFTCGSDAVKAAEGIAPDLILLDQMMPEMTGDETLANLRKIQGLQDTPAVFLTAVASDVSARLMEQTDAIAIIPKPFDPMTLASELRAYWDSTRQ